MSSINFDNNLEYGLSENNEGADLPVHNSLIDRVKRITSISEVLRIFGACAVIASLSLFMLEGWSDGNDISRYLKLLGQTGLLTLAGLLLSFVVREFKGARLFFGLGLVSAVTNFTILGALIYSILPLDDLLGHYPAAVTWTVGSSSHFLMICIGASALLTLLARFSYSIFARRIAAPLTVSFLGLNALLLIPMRDTLTVSILTVVALLIATQVVKKLSCQPSLVLTPETKFAFATLFLPGLIIAGRAVSLYHVDELFFLTLSGLAYYAIRLLVARINAESEHPANSFSLLQVMQCGLGFVIAVLATQIMPNWIDNFAAAIFSLIVLVITADQIFQSRSKYAGSVLLNVSAMLVVAMNLIFALASSLLVVKLASLGICLSLFVFAHYIQEHTRGTNFARLTTLFGIAVTFILVTLKLIAWINISNWMTIGLLGMFLIVIGSCYERFGLKLPSLKAAIKPSDVANDTGTTAESSSLER